MVPLVDPHWRKPAHGTLSSLTATKPEHGDTDDFMPAYVSLMRTGPRPLSLQCTRSVELACDQPPELGQPWKT